MLKCVVLFPLLALSSFATSTNRVAAKIGVLVKSSAAIQHARVGFKFVDVESGAVLAAQDSTTFFTPASNAKLYTTALALVRLGPDYKFKTEVRTSGAWREGQLTVPNLELVGGGDPNLSGRSLPYTAHSVNTDPFGALKELAAKLAAAGLREVSGDVTGVATRYPGDLYPDGWTLNDAIYDYGAPVTALALNDNAVSVCVQPAAEGELAAITLQPATSHLIILNEVVTDYSNNTAIHLARRPHSNELVLWGTIGKSANAWREDVAVDDPALFAAEALIDALREQNITVRGVARSQYVASSGAAIEASQSGTVLAVHESAPLWQALEVINKVSQNLHAEMLLREVAHKTRGAGTLAAGDAEREVFLQEAGITHQGTGFVLDDGSGLARQDLTTPASTIALLRYMWECPERDVWLRTLPVGAVDGSLEHRFHHVRGAERVHAKTGSLSHVNTLSGYIETKRHRWLAFSVMVNATAGEDSDVHNFIDRLCAIFLNE